MKRFSEKWNHTENIDFFVNVLLMAEAEEKWPNLEETKMMVFKMNQGNPKTETPEEEPEEEEEENIRKDELYGNRHLRYEKRRKAKHHLREIEPLTMSVRQTRNGGIIHKGNTYGWFPEWKRADHRSERYAGKELCRRYDIPEREIIPTVEDIDPEGTWDVESQCFLYDRKKRTIKRRLRDVEEMEFPAIIIAEVDHVISWGVDTEVYSLGLIESVEEGKEAVEKFIARFPNKGSFPDITINSAPIKGTLFIGGAFYEEAEEVD